MRRHTLVGRNTPAGSSRVERLDPFSLPVQFSVADKAADGRMRTVVLSRERIVVRRAVQGIKMAVNLPVSAYLGVALRMEPPDGGLAGVVSIVLEHRDRALSLPLFCDNDGTEIVAEWQSWARVLGMPLLIADADGRLREAFARLGAVRIASPIRRRRQRSGIRMRRPSILMRRKMGQPPADQIVHRDEREIIARN